jgi:hypothetical protein
VKHRDHGGSAVGPFKPEGNIHEMPTSAARWYGNSLIAKLSSGNGPYCVSCFDLETRWIGVECKLRAASGPKARSASRLGPRNLNLGLRLACASEVES